MVEITEKAAAKVQKHLHGRGKGIGIMVGVRTTGCSGLAYKLEYVDQIVDETIKYESNGINIFVSPKDLPYLDGMIMDWKREGLNEGFDFINSKEKNRCGCGDSFTV